MDEMVFPRWIYLNLPLPRERPRREMIRHGFSPPGERTDSDSFDITNTEIITRNNGRGVIIEEWEKVRGYCF